MKSIKVVLNLKWHDTIMARITPCLENGKIAKVSILNNDEVGFGQLSI